MVSLSFFIEPSEVCGAFSCVSDGKKKSFARHGAEFSSLAGGSRPCGSSREVRRVTLDSDRFFRVLVYARHCVFPASSGDDDDAGLFFQLLRRVRLAICRIVWEKSNR